MEKEGYCWNVHSKESRTKGSKDRTPVEKDKTARLPVYFDHTARLPVDFNRTPSRSPLSRTYYKPPDKVRGIDLPTKFITMSDKKEDIYAPLEEDVDLTKVLVDFNTENLAGAGAGDVSLLRGINKQSQKCS
ncbi:unnamed protein product [Strongylus vulgaris]|uniref:Uncharacterized protein n=1 Tax=Strongylus vulgaris TaxID=40348 RepID=A0A3P7IKT6_STRVU|nr:unnamed protein product [Strongylus vulgaris]